MKKTILLTTCLLAGLTASTAVGLEIPENNGWLRIHHKATLSLNSVSNWVDTGLVATKGWEMRVIAQGMVTLGVTLDGGAAGQMDADGVAGLDDKDPRKKMLSKTNELFPAPELTAYALIGRIRNDRGEVVNKFVLGKDVVMDIPAEGRMEFTINDAVKADNEGELLIFIYLRKKERVGF